MISLHIAPTYLYTHPFMSSRVNVPFRVYGYFAFNEYHKLTGHSLIEHRRQKRKLKYVSLHAIYCPLIVLIYLDLFNSKVEYRSKT